MSDNRGYKVIAIVALLIGVIGVTLGYAAFQNTLTFTPSADVTANNGLFNVDFSSDSDSAATNAIVADLSPNNVTGFTATNGSISNSGNPTVTGMKATFTAPGQTATYTFYARNVGSFKAYLNGITFTGTKTCSAKQGVTATNDYVQAACSGISMSVTIGEDANAPVYTSSNSSINNMDLDIGDSVQITVTLTYAANSSQSDGDFDVTFPSVTLTYDSVEL